MDDCGGVPDPCPSLDELLLDPLLEGEWQFLDQGFADFQEDADCPACPSDVFEATEYGGIGAGFDRSTEHSNCHLRADSPQENMTDGQTTSSIASREETPEGSSPEDEAERQKRLKRMQRNRESASLSRERKKIQMADKDKQITELHGKLKGLTAFSNQLVQENALLRQQVANLCHTFGQPLPQNLYTALQPMASATSIALPPYLQAPGSVQIDKVPIQRLPVKRPAPAVSVNNPRKQKRRKQQAVAGGTTLMAAVFCFMFLGFPLPRMQEISDNNALTEDFLQHQGRVLQATGNETVKDTALSWLAHPEQNSTTHQLIQPTDLETRTLQHLKAIGPLAVFSKYDVDKDNFEPPAPWKSLGSLADSALARDGIAKSFKCTKEFSVDTSAVEDPQAARQTLQRYMAQTTSFKGRYSALALPPVEHQLPSLEAKEAKSGSREEQRIGCANKEEDDDYIISVMMPTKDQLDGYTSLSKMYVVVLNPNKKYAAYSCGLGRPILM